jgi:hypothetical protein
MGRGRGVDVSVLNRLVPVVAACVLMVAAAVWAAAPAEATPTWLPTATLSLAGADAQYPHVAVDGHGNTVAVWRWYDGSNQVIQAAHRPAGGSWGLPLTLSDAGQDAGQPQVAVNERGDAVAVWWRSDGNNTRVQAARRPAGGSWGTPVTLSAEIKDAFEPQVALDRLGNAVVVWTRYSETNDRVQVSRQPAHGSWSAPINLSAAGQNAGAPQVAANGQGTAVAVWSRFDGSHGRVQAARRPAGGSWGTRFTLSAAGQDAGNHQIAIDEQGNAVAVWFRGDSSNNRVQTARQVPGGTWTSPVNLSAPGGNANEPQIEFDGQGNSVAVWTAIDGTTRRVQTARRIVGGPWGSPLNLSATGRDAYSPQLAVNAHGSTVAVWERSDGVNDRVQVARRPVGDSWGAPRLLSAAGQNGHSSRVAIDTQGNAVAVWSRSDGTNTRAQARGLDAAGPISTMSRPTRWAQTSTTFGLAWTAADRWSPVASHDVRYRYAPYYSGFGTTTMWRSATLASSTTFTARPGRTYCFSARARDTLNNLGPWSAQRCTAVPLDDRTLSADSSWSRRTGTSSYLGTFTAAHANGATLTRTGVRTKRLALLVTTCATCGVVKVSFAGISLGRFNLASASTVHRKIISVRTFAAVRSGALKIQIVSADKPVYIDGVVVSRV